MPNTLPHLSGPYEVTRTVPGQVTITTGGTSLATSPARMWGNETVVGTRIPTFRIVELATDGGYTPEKIAADVYPDLAVDTIRERGRCWWGSPGPSGSRRRRAKSLGRTR